MNYTFHRKIQDENSTSGFRIEKEQVREERWGWGVVYKDDTELHQFDRTKQEFHQFAEIEQDRVKLFVMYKLEGAETRDRVDMPIDPDAVQLFHFYRQMVLENGGRRVTVYVFGWKHRISGEAAYHYILPDDRLIVSRGETRDLPAFNL